MATRKIWSILGNSQRLDGGSMFGNAPRVLWSRWIEPDELNRIPLACRAMLIEDGDRRLLFETGIGAFFSPRLRDRYGVQESAHVLLDSLRAVGVAPAAVDTVVLSHLHFDHAGGLLAAHEDGEPAKLLFDNARYVVSRAAWQRALAPHARDKASFIRELPALLESSGRLEIVDGHSCAALGADYRLHYSEGHTPGLMLTEVPSDDGPVIFAGDLIPGAPWLHAPITMGYDRFPERLIDEKSALLEDLVSRDGRVFFTHDHTMAMARVQRTESGRFAAAQSWPALNGLAL